MKEYTLEACSWIELPDTDYVNSWREALNNPETRKEIEKIENEERSKDEDKEVTESQELILTIFKEKVLKEMQLDV